MASTMKLFSKTITHTDVHKRLSIPSKSLTSFPCFQGGRAVDFQVEDENGHVWTMRCTIRKQKYKKPVISSGWNRFVLTKMLNIGDKVTFFKVEDEATGTKYKIKVEKAIKVFKATLGYASDYGTV